MLYDGVCIFCNTSVDFVLANEKSTDLLFTPLQSEIGKHILKRYNYPTDYVESILFLTSGKLLSKSTAALQVAKFLKIPFSWLSIFTIVPKVVRDFVYDTVAKNRYKWFGKYDACRIPSPELKKRFLD